MSERIYKYTVPDDGEPIAMPRGAVILCAQAQHGRATIWARVDIEAPPVSRLILALPTGALVRDGLAYIGTAQFHGGAFVLHIFDGGEVAP